MRPDRDDPLASAIRQTLQAGRTDCPDAEAIAAYAERALGRAERRSIDEHLSNCSRCRETLLMMEKMKNGTVTVFQKTKSGTSPLFRWPWLAAAAAAGLATVMWLKLPPSALRAPEPEPVAQVPSDAAKEKPPAGAEEVAANKAPAAGADAAARKRVAAAPRSTAPVAGPVAPPPPAALESFGERAKLGDNRRRDEQKIDEVAERRGKVEQPVPAPSAQLPAGVAEPAPAAAGEARQSVSRDALMARQNREYLIASSRKRALGASAAAPEITWRVWASGVLERSADAGVSWTREAGVDALGARDVMSPSADVCWIVGDAGLILRFASGRGWTRITPPAQVGFVGVEASDALQATITAADGRRFTTPDGGASWK